MSNEAIIYIASSIVTILTIFIKSHYDTKKLLALREQDRLDRESDAAIARADKAELLAAGDKRKDEIIKATRQVREVAVKSALKSEQALRVANGHNEKIAAAIEVSKELLTKSTSDETRS